jgi:hypothetical protein
MSRADFATGFHGRAKILRLQQPILASQHLALLLGRKLYATLAATSRKDGATGTGTHTKAETVGLCATTVVWLESTLSHIYSKGMCEVQVLHRRCHVLVSANL